MEWLVVASLRLDKQDSFSFAYGLTFKKLLTLGAHAQRGLLYLVCVSVCVCVCVCVCLHLFSHYRDQAGSSAIPTALAQQGLEKLCGDFA